MPREVKDIETHAAHGILLVIVIILCVLLSGCAPSLNRSLQTVLKTETNAQVTSVEIKEQYPLLTAKLHTAWYPVQESRDTQTEIIQGNSEELKKQLRSAQSEADSLKAALASIPVKPECQPEVMARDKVIAQLQNRIASLNTMADNLKADVQKVTNTITKESNAKVEAAELLAAQGRDLRIREETEHEQTKKELSNVTRHRLILGILLGIGLLGLIGMAVIRFYLRRV